MLPFEPAPTTENEITTLRAMLAMQRSILLWKVDGLSEEDARRPMVPSGTSILGVVKHMARVERAWFVDFIGEGEWKHRPEDREAEFRPAPDESIGDIVRTYVDAVAAADAVIDAAPDLDVTGAFERGPADRRERSLRWVLVHMIEETARHAGHLDILREQVDGSTGYYPE